MDLNANSGGHVTKFPSVSDQAGPVHKGFKRFKPCRHEYYAWKIQNVLSKCHCLARVKLERKEPHALLKPVAHSTLEACRIFGRWNA
eukprot:scaffold289999_cov35-Tisochrysis_lutea.AAC.3